MQLSIRRSECQHVVWKGPMGDSESVIQTGESLRGGSCPTCDEPIGSVYYVGVPEDASIFEQPPTPGRTEDNPRPKRRKFHLP